MFLILVSTWLVLASMYRVVLEMEAGRELDFQPFVGFAFGVFGWLLLIALWDERKLR